MIKPKIVTEKHLKFLDNLRDSGKINMYEAIPYIEKAYPKLSWVESSKILSYWMKTYSDRHKKG